MKSEHNLSEDVLRNSEELHRTILRASMDGFWVVDLDGRLLEVNDAYCRMSGYSQAELLAMGVFDLEAFESKELTAAHMAKIAERGEDRFETRHRRKDGNLIDVEVSGRHCPVDGGRIIIFLRDITEHRQAEKDREQFFKFFQTSADLMCIADIDGNFIRTNPAFTETLGYSETELLSKSYLEFIHPDDRQETLAETARQLQRGGFSCNYRNRYICKNGAVKWLSWRVTYNKAEGIAYGTARDITDIKRADEVFLENEKRMSFALQAGNMGLYDLNVQTGEAVVNPEYARMLGYDPAELQETDSRWIERLHPDDRKRVVSAFHAYVNGKMPHYNVEFRQRTRDGGWKWILAYGRIMERDPDGTPRRMLGVHVDITERKQAEETLRASRNLLHSILENVPIRVFWKDAELRYLGCNTAFAHDAGFSHPEELLGKDDFQMGWRKQAELYRADDRRVMDSGTPEIGIEEPQTTPDGQTISLRTSKVPLRDSENNVVGVLGIYEDITQRKKAEVALRDSEEQLRVIFDASQAGIILVAPRGTILFANNSMAEMFGMPIGQLIGSSYLDHLPEAERQIGDARMRQLIRGDIRAVSTERRYLRADGSEFWGFLSGKRLENPDGTLRALLGIIADISEPKRVEEALRESENRLRFALEGSNDGLWDVQMRTNTTYLSPRGWEILGYRPGEEGGVIDDWSCLVHPEDLQLTNERLRAHIEGRTPIFQVEQRLRTQSGEWKWVLTRGKVVARDADGTPLRITGTHTDLTGQKILQEQLGQAQKMESMGRLAGGVAHDFNNMLSVILGHTQLALKSEEVIPPLREHLEQILKATERSGEIVRQLLAFARKQTVTPKVVDLNQTVSGMLKILGRLIGEDIELTWLPGEGVWPVRMDTAQIDQLLVNLCVNARDSIAGIGRITIETGNKNCDAGFCDEHPGCIPGKYVLITVSDDGCGMEKETVKKIFEPFFTTKGVGRGTGLGLATVYGIVKQNDGYIWVDTEPGQGTTFKIYLPRYQGKEKQAWTEGLMEPAVRGNETVLMVEDEPAILDLGRQILEMQGYRMLIAGTPGEAIRMAIEHVGEIHLLLTDVIMPEMNGRELAEKLLSLYPGLKCLFMSGYTADVIAHHGVLDEGVHFIQKPFSLDALAAKVRATLDG